MDYSQKPNDKNLNSQLAERQLTELLSHFSGFAQRISSGKFPQFAPPFSKYNESDTDIRSYLESVFSKYKKLVAKISNIECVNICMGSFINKVREQNGNSKINKSFNIIEEIDLIIKMILSALDEYFIGFPSKAYQVFEETFTRDNGHLIMLLPHVQLLSGSFTFYRVREGKFNDDSELFHLPFNKRYKCGNYRYSVNGTPSLYCAGSIETCILENMISDNKNITIAKFELPSDGDVMIIDMNLPGDRDLYFWEQYSLLVFFPLILACSLKVRHPEEKFKPEYVIPQLFYQTMRLCNNLYSNIVGISYTSTKYEMPRLNNAFCHNYAFFVKPSESKDSKFDNTLANMLTISDLIQTEYTNSTDINTIQSELMKAKTRPLKL